MTQRRPKPWAETNRQGRTRYAWRFQDQRYWTNFYDDPEEARADATTQITEQVEGSWHERTGRRMLLEDWIDVWVGMLGDIEPTTRAKYKYFVEGFILPQFQGRQIGSLEFDEIETWDNTIPTRIARGRPYARSVASSARSLLITILGDAVHAGKIDRNPAERRKGRRGRMRAKGRAPSQAASQQSTANVITPFQGLCLAERCALLSGRDIDFVMSIFAAWTGVRWGELLAVEGWPGKGSPLQLPQAAIATYAVDWQLRELGGVVRKSAPKDGSYRVLDLPPFLADLIMWAMDNRRETCLCPLTDSRPACKGDSTGSGHRISVLPGFHSRLSRPQVTCGLPRRSPHPAASRPSAAHAVQGRPACLSHRPAPRQAGNPTDLVPVFTVPGSPRAGRGGRAEGPATQARMALPASPQSSLISREVMAMLAVEGVTKSFGSGRVRLRQAWHGG
jgi:hypothetical protein